MYKVNNNIKMVVTLKNCCYHFNFLTTVSIPNMITKAADNTSKMNSSI